MHIKYSVRWLYGESSPNEIEPVLFSLLDAIRREGSLKKGSQRTGLSYRYAWGLIKLWEERLQARLVMLERGRGHGSYLSDFGEKLLLADQSLNDRVNPQLESIATEFNLEFDRYIEPEKQTIFRISASHGMAIVCLIDLLQQQSNMEIEFWTHGSLESLRMLDNGQCDIAGFHFPLDNFTDKLVPLYRPWLDTTKHSLLLVAIREQGIMTQTSNPKHISTIKDLTKRSARFINRQRDSGTRIIFDNLLLQADIQPSKINGYTNEEFTHVAVAAMISSGAVDAGFGIKAAARKFNLNFIPILKEAYVLALNNDLPLNLKNTVKQLLTSEKFKKNINKFSGYNVSKAGTDLEIDALFSNRIKLKTGDAKL